MRVHLEVVKQIGDDRSREFVASWTACDSLVVLNVDTAANVARAIAQSYPTNTKDDLGNRYVYCVEVFESSPDWSSPCLARVYGGMTQIFSTNPTII